MVDIAPIVQENKRLKEENEKLREEMKAERLRNLKNPISAVGRIIMDFYDTVYGGKSYELSKLLSKLTASNMDSEDSRARYTILNLINYPIGHWIWSLKERWEWLDEHREPDNEYLVQLANETRRAINGYHCFLVESKKIFDKYDDFKKKNGNDLKNMYDIYNRIAENTDSFIKTYGQIYGIDDMVLERIAYE